jgi:hypothetical protein
MANAELEARIPSVEFNGRPLYEWSMTDVYAATLTPDAHQLLVDTFGFYSGIGPHNAADGIPYLLREAGAILEDQETPVDGMERLPRELADRFFAGGGSVRLGYRLLGFDVEPGVGDLPGLRLRFQGKPPIMAHRLILAVPRVALEAVAAASPVLHGPEITDLLGATEAYAAHKFYLVYERPWWRDGGSTSRHDVSDLPLRKTYYLDSETAPSGTPALLLASYADGVQLDPWRELADLDSPGDESRPFGAPDRWQDFRAPEALVQAAQAQLSALHDRPQVPEPIASMYQRWDLERQGGGWHYWRKGARYWEVKERIVQPVDDLPVFVCGEAYSTSQAWVEGAFETAEAVLDRIA